MNSKSGVLKKILLTLKVLAPLFDIFLAPITLIAVIWFRIARYWGVKNLPLTRKIFLNLGLFPIVDHYYEPLFDFRKIKSPQRKDLEVTFAWNKQVSFLKQFNYGVELRSFPNQSTSLTGYFYSNGSFGSGDAELYYSLIRKFKPRKILEIGSGFSTRIALHAVDKNREVDLSYSCLITCVEPYEMPWLENLKVNLKRKKVEEVDLEFFDQLNDGDILFIDSSHIIRPGGDVTFIILNVLQKLKKGVWIHFHDIFTPGNYPLNWMKNEFRMWNEQYLLEAFLINNDSFEVVVAMNFINKYYRKDIDGIFPLLSSEIDREPGSFWLRKIK